MYRLSNSPQTSLLNSYGGNIALTLHANTTIKSLCNKINKAQRGCGQARNGDGLQRYLRVMSNGSPEWLFPARNDRRRSTHASLLTMMIRWSTDACRRDPSIVSSNLTSPTFLLRVLCYFVQGPSKRIRRRRLQRSVDQHRSIEGSAEPPAHL